MRSEYQMMTFQGFQLTFLDISAFIQVEQYAEAMKGIYTTSINKKTLDEAPFAYKPMKEIISNIGDTVDVISVVQPMYNFKAGG